MHPPAHLTSRERRRRYDRWRSPRHRLPYVRWPDRASQNRPSVYPPVWRTGRPGSIEALRRQRTTRAFPKAPRLPGKAECGRRAGEVGGMRRDGDHAEEWQTWKTPLNELERPRTGEKGAGHEEILFVRYHDSTQKERSSKP